MNKLFKKIFISIVIIVISVILFRYLYLYFMAKILIYSNTNKEIISLLNNTSQFNTNISLMDNIVFDNKTKQPSIIFCKNLPLTYIVPPLKDRREIPLIYKESQLAHQFLDNLKGIEIGASAHNPYGLNTIKVDFSCNDTDIIANQVNAAWTFEKVDIAAPAEQLPFADSSLDFVLTSYVIEHMYDPVKAIKEWLRVVRPKGYVFISAPHRERSPQDQHRERTKLSELIDRHERPNPPKFSLHEHYSVWTMQEFLELCSHYNWIVVAAQDVDDKIGVGFAVVIQKQ